METHWQAVCVPVSRVNVWTLRLLLTRRVCRSSGPWRQSVKQWCSLVMEHKVAMLDSSFHLGVSFYWWTMNVLARNRKC
eukprot:1863267-Rhodomonas_salina.1